MENQNSATLENHFEEIWKYMKEIIQETRKELQNSINEAFKPIMEKLGDLKASNERALNIIQELKITLPDDEVDVLDFGEEEYNQIPLNNQAEELPKQAKGNFLPVIEFFSPFLERNLIVGKFYTKQNESSMADKVYDEMPRRVFNSSNTEKGGSVYVIMNQFSPKYDDSGGREADIQVTGAGTHGELFNICDRNKEYNSSTMSTIRKNTFISVIRYANWDTRVNNFPSAFMSSSIVADVFQESASSKAYGSEQIQLLTDHRSKMVTIQSVKVRQIFHNRGNPTVEVDVGLSDGTWSKDAVPSGASTRIYEARELRDGGSNYLGKGVLKAVGNVNTIIGPALIGKDPTDQTGIDDYMVQQLDGTINEWGWCKQKLGANAMLAVSIAVCKAGASVLNIPLCKQIANLAGNKKLVLPVPAFNVINGGSHAGNKLAM